MSDTSEIARLTEAVRDRLQSSSQTGSQTGSAGARRLFHGRGHCYPGLEQVTIDWYAPVLVISIFRRDASSGWIAELAEAISASVGDVGGVAIQHRDGRRTRCEVVRGAVPEQLLIEEHGLKFQIQPLANQNVGFFLDMAPARRWVEERSSQRRVLNLFAFTCAFSVAALAGGATEVVNNDMSRSALDRGRENHLLNGHDPRSVRYVPHNLFKSWWKLKQFGRYDLTIVDPPTNQRGSFVAEKNYGAVLRRLPDLMAPGGDVLLCLNSPFLPFHFLEDQMARRCPGYRLVERIDPSEDFPELDADRGLKIGLFRAPG